jgi:hypothetical protein
MSEKTKITKKNIETERKRVNLTLDLKTFDLLFLIAEAKNTNHTTIAKMLLTPEIERVAKDLFEKQKYVPKAQRGLKFL